MKRRTIISILAVAISLSLVGCGEKDSKIVNNSIVNEAKVISLEPYGYKNYDLKMSTSKGDFCTYGSSRYAEQIKDLYNLKKHNNKDLIVDIIYDNTSEDSNKVYHVKEIVVDEQ